MDREYLNELIRMRNYAWDEVRMKVLYETKLRSKSNKSSCWGKGSVSFASRFYSIGLHHAQELCSATRDLLIFSRPQPKRFEHAGTKTLEDNTIWYIGLHQLVFIHVFFRSNGDPSGVHEGILRYLRRRRDYDPKRLLNSCRFSRLSLLMSDISAKLIWPIFVR